MITDDTLKSVAKNIIRDMMEKSLPPVPDNSEVLDKKREALDKMFSGKTEGAKARAAQAKEAASKSLSESKSQVESAGKEAKENTEKAIQDAMNESGQVFKNKFGELKELAAGVNELSERTPNLMARVAAVKSLQASGLAETAVGGLAGPAGIASGATTLLQVKQSNDNLLAEGQGLAGTYKKVESGLDKLNLPGLSGVPGVGALVSAIKGVLGASKAAITLTGASI